MVMVVRGGSGGGNNSGSARRAAPLRRSEHGANNHSSLQVGQRCGGLILRQAQDVSQGQDERSGWLVDSWTFSRNDLGLVSARGEGFRWSLSAPRPGDLRMGFGSLKVRRKAHGSGMMPLPWPLLELRRGECAVRPACELALAPLRPRRVGIVRTLVMAGTGMRFGF